MTQIRSSWENAQLPRTETAISALGGRLRNFGRSDDGSMTYMAFFLSILMLVFGGIGIDLMYAELQRNKIQNTLDRAVLAAADLDNTLDAAEVVQDYMEKMGVGDTLIRVDASTTLTSKSVLGEGYKSMPSNFAEIITPIKALQAYGLARAEEQYNKVEISLVLDVSGSMDDGDKMSSMQDAAAEFIETVLAGGARDYTSVNLVPYSEHVNAGPEILSYMNVDWKHGYSHCLEMPDRFFAQTELDLSYEYDQMQHYQWNFDGRNNARNDTICPRYSYERITPWSNDANELTDQVYDLKPRAGTSIFMGMKWGTALLDPSTRGIVSGMISDTAVDSVFEGRPADYNDGETAKTIVLMTDGQHDRSYRIQDWAYDSASEYAHWERYNLWYYLNNYVRSSSWSGFYTQKYNATTGDTLLGNICTAAKSQGIVIWAIGFEVQDHGADVMERCASSSSHFYRVNREQIVATFKTIAGSINQLKLVQ
ncbi:pilus assembly protein [Salipiger aestuarii]|uniref:pilus assembly protein n=1 Tax=Salipiger aestuarii TaxID=568098 RepID=UPI00123C026B|nr:pilus assembly protein TadG-related protein [Salipiger aestuarii]